MEWQYIYCIDKELQKNSISFVGLHNVTEGCHVTIDTLSLLCLHDVNRGICLV